MFKHENWWETSEAPGVILSNELIPLPGTGELTNEGISHKFTKRKPIATENVKFTMKVNEMVSASVRYCGTLQEAEKLAADLSAED